MVSNRSGTREVIFKSLREQAEVDKAVGKKHNYAANEKENRAIL
jgi:hypothetical protein